MIRLKAWDRDAVVFNLDDWTLGRYVPGSVLKIVTAIAGLDSGAITPQTTFPEQPGDETTGLLVDGFKITDGHHPSTDGTALDLTGATEVSCNIWYALAGLRIGGDKLVSEAAQLGFGAPIPFDLATASSQLTNGGGPLRLQPRAVARSAFRRRAATGREY